MTETRQQLLAAAQDLFLSQGFVGTTIQQLADAAGISKGAVYLHFRSKTDVMIGLLDDLACEVIEEARAILDQQDVAPRDKLREQFRFQFEGARAHRQLFEIYVRDAGVEIDEGLTLMAQKMRVDWQLLQETFLEQAFPELDSRFTSDLAVSVNGALNEYYTYAVLEGIEVDGERVADFVVGLAEALVSHLANGGVLPVLEPGALPSTGDIEQKMEKAREGRIDQALVEMAEAAREMEEPVADEVGQTIRALERALAEDERERVVLQGLLANLREIRELQPQRRTLAHELGLRLL